MSFWSTTTATPTIWHRMSFSPTPGYIRTEPVGYPAIPEGFTKPLRFFRSDAAVVAEFWKANYGGDDWYLNSDTEFVLRYLVKSNVYIFGIFQIDTMKLIGTIVSTPLTDGSTLMSHGARLSNVRVIEGLCIHRDFRGSGIAGFLIGYMDAFTSQLNRVPVVHLWGREMSKMPFLTTALRTDSYAYKVCTRKPPGQFLNFMAWDEFCDLWKTSSPHWIHDKVPRIVATCPLSLHCAFDVWTYPADSLVPDRPVVVVSNTHRKTRDKHLTIYEVVWCGYMRNNILYPAKSSIQYKQIIDDISNQYNGLLFASSAVYNGGANILWGADWNYGKSGMHAWFLYNYIPPSFGNCELLTIRDEL